MQLTINAGGITGLFSVMDLQINLNSMIDRTSDVIGAFKTIKDDTYGLSGGVGVLQEALDNIDMRMSEESRKQTEQEDFRSSVEDFLDLAVEVDAGVAKTMSVNEEKFYQLYPGLRPVVEVEEEQNWLEKAWGWLCGTAEEVGDFLSDSAEWIAGKVKEEWEKLKDGAAKIWNCAVEFYNKHKDVIHKAIATILIVAGAVLSIAAIIASGGTALVGLLGLVGITGTLATTISTVVAGVAIVTTVVASTMNVVDTWAEIDHPMFNAFQNVFNIASAVTTAVYDIGEFYNAFKTLFSKKTAKKAAKEAVESTADDVLRAVPDNPPDSLMKTVADGLDDGVDDAIKALPEGPDSKMAGYDSLTDYYEAVDAGGPKNTTQTVKPSNAQYPKGGGDYVDDLFEIEQYADGRYVPGEKGVVTKGDSTKLGENINKQMGLDYDPPGYENAHIIGSENANHRVLKEIGMDLNDASNGIKRPKTAGHTLSQHRGYHKLESRFVTERLDELAKTADSLNLNPAQRNEFLQKGVREIQRDTRKMMQEGLPGYVPKTLRKAVTRKDRKLILNDSTGQLLHELLEQRLKTDRGSFEAWVRSYKRISKDPDFSKLAETVMGISP